MEFSIDIEYIWNLYEKQNKKCALSNLPIYFIRNNDKDKDRTASIDRINPKIGYTKENVQIVHKAVNFMKSTLDNDIFIYICKKISNNNKNIKIDKSRLKHCFNVGSNSLIQLKS